MPLRHLACVLLVLLLVAGCGDGDPVVPDHGLAKKDLANRPEGDAVALAYDTPDGAAYRAVLSITTEAWKKGTEGGRPKDQRLTLRATMEHTWAIQQPAHGAPTTSRVTLRYLEANGHGADTLLERAPITGRLAHDPRGRAVPASLQLAGGTKAEQLEVKDLVGSLLLAGYGGAPSWFPDRPVQPGEAWPLAPLLELRVVQNLRGRARELGMSNAEPTFTGTARLKRVTEGPDGPLLEVELDALIELEGRLRDGDGAARAFSSGDRFQGLATIDATTGVPTTFDVSHVHREHQARGDETVAIGATATVRGTVTRTDKRR